MSLAEPGATVVRIGILFGHGATEAFNALRYEAVLDANRLTSKAPMKATNPSKRSLKHWQPRDAATYDRVAEPTAEGLKDLIVVDVHTYRIMRAEEIEQRRAETPRPAGWPAWGMGDMSAGQTRKRPAPASNASVERPQSKVSRTGEEDSPRPEKDTPMNLETDTSDRGKDQPDTLGIEGAPNKNPPEVLPEASAEGENPPDVEKTAEQETDKQADEAVSKSAELSEGRLSEEEAANLRVAQERSLYESAPRMEQVDEATTREICRRFLLNDKIKDRGLSSFVKSKITPNGQRTIAEVRRIMELYQEMLRAINMEETRVRNEQPEGIEIGPAAVNRHKYLLSMQTKSVAEAKYAQEQVMSDLLAEGYFEDPEESRESTPEAPAPTPTTNAHKGRGGAAASRGTASRGQGRQDRGGHTPSSAGPESSKQGGEREANRGRQTNKYQGPNAPPTTCGW